MNNLSNYLKTYRSLCHSCYGSKVRQVYGWKIGRFKYVKCEGCNGLGKIVNSKRYIYFEYLK